MPVIAAIQGAPAGAAGSPYSKLIAAAAKAIGNYVLTDTNFPGLGVLIPTWCFVSLITGVGGAATVQLSNDNGTTWFTLYSVGASAQGGGAIFIDSATTVRVSLTGAAADVRLWILAR